MSKLDEETGNKERTIDIQMIMNMANITNLNKNKGIDLVARLAPFQSYITLAMKDSLLLYNRVMLTGPATDVLAADDTKSHHYGVNYASADYLGLAQHPEAKKNAIKAIQKYGITAGNVPSGLGAHE